MIRSNKTHLLTAASIAALLGPGGGSLGRLYLGRQERWPGQHAAQFRGAWTGDGVRPERVTRQARNREWRLGVRAEERRETKAMRRRLYPMTGGPK